MWRPNAQEQKLAVRSRDTKRSVVRLLNAACGVVDDIAYRPLVVNLTKRLPWFWCCHLTKLSMALDDRWRTEYWKSPNAPPAPDGPCDACGRRAGWLEVGGPDGPDEVTSSESEVDYLSTHPVTLCGWCHLDIDRSGSPRNAADLERLLSDAGARSIGWRWRWHPG